MLLGIKLSSTYKKSNTHQIREPIRVKTRQGYYKFRWYELKLYK